MGVSRRESRLGEQPHGCLELVSMQRQRAQSSLPQLPVTLPCWEALPALAVTSQKKLSCGCVVEESPGGVVLGDLVQGCWHPWVPGHSPGTGYVWQRVEALGGVGLCQVEQRVGIWKVFY